MFIIKQLSFHAFRIAQLLVVIIALTGIHFSYAQSGYQLIGGCEPLNDIVSSACPDVDTCFTLTPDLTGQSGAVWDQNQIDLSNSFDATFCLTLGSHDADGADGFAFVLRGVGSATLGSVGGGIGYQGISPSVAIEFDTWDNGTSFDDITEDHTGIYVNADYITPLVAAVPLNPAGSNVEDGQYHNARIVWNATTKDFKMYFDGNLRASANMDLVNDVFSGDSQVYWGFTASTGGATNLQQICFPYSSIHVEDGAICEKDSFALHYYTPDITSYTWYKAPNDTLVNWNTIDFTDPFNLDDTLIYVSESGDYVLKIDFNNNSFVDTATVVVIPLPLAPFADINMTYCPDQVLLELDALNPGSTYTWQPAQGNNQIIQDYGGEGWYEVLIEEPILGCSVSDSIFVTAYCDPDASMPNIFTPNGDGLNDLFLPIYAVSPKWVKVDDFYILDRWGLEVYSYATGDPGWDGKVNGKEANNGVYYYSIRYSDINGEKQEQKDGFFHLIQN